MFKIPDWDADTPNEINLKNNKPKNKKNKTNVPPSPKQNGVPKPSFKPKKGKINKNLVKKSNNIPKFNLPVKNEIGKKEIIKFKKQKPKKEKNYVSIKNDTSIDMDKLNELILKEKKRKIKNKVKNVEKFDKSIPNNKKQNPNKNQTDKKENPNSDSINGKNSGETNSIENTTTKSKKRNLKRNKSKEGNNFNNNKNTEHFDSDSLDTSVSKSKKKKLNRDKSKIEKNPVSNQNNKSSSSDNLDSSLTNEEEKTTDNEDNNDESMDFDTESFDTDKLDELILKEKKKKLSKYNNDDIEEMLFSENKKRKLSPDETQDQHEEVKTKAERKKELLKSVLQKDSNRNQINVTNSSNSLRDRMLEKLKAAKFRYLNEKLYTSSGSEAQQIFQSDPSAFQTYHEGYQQQVKKWPVKPLDVIIQRIKKMPKTYKIADMGCGEAELSQRVAQKVRSFDLVATSERVEACDIAKTPLLSAEVDVAVYCLALMGTDLTRYLLEANRVLRMGGHLLIAEVESRFSKVDDFTRDVQKLGFSLKKLDKSQKVFFFMEFTKVRDPPAKKAKLPTLSLKPCIYKKR